MKEREKNKNESQLKWNRARTSVRVGERKEKKEEGLRRRLVILGM